MRQYSSLVRNLYWSGSIGRNCGGIVPLRTRSRQAYTLISFASIINDRFGDRTWFMFGLPIGPESLYSPPLITMVFGSGLSSHIFQYAQSKHSCSALILATRGDCIKRKVSRSSRLPQNEQVINECATSLQEMTALNYVRVNGIWIMQGHSNVCFN